MNMPKMLDGKAVAAEVKAEVKDRAAAFLAAHGRSPFLAIVLASEDSASWTYVSNKSRDCDECGIRHETVLAPAVAQEADVIRTVRKLCDDPDVDGVMVQLPLRPGLDPEHVLAAIDPDKDVDGLTDRNVGRLWGRSREFYLKPCTPAGIVRLLTRYYGPDSFAGMNAVIVNRSNIVGKPMAAMLLDLDMTVTVCHSKTTGLSNVTRTADVLVTGVGRPGFITRDMVGPRAIVVDVSMNRDANGRLCGDLALDVGGIAAYTPVPGGVGPMTRAMLMLNTVLAAEHRATGRT